MKHSILAVAIALASGGAVPARAQPIADAARTAVADGRRFEAPSTVPRDYHLVWSDEFSGAGRPDESNWTYDTEANKSGWYNDELQYYAARRKRNAEVGGGTLRITARKEGLSSEADYGGQRYSSARLISQGKREFTYGFFDIRAKLPCGRGTWPAIWMLGSTSEWPDGGEIDIMEQVGKTPRTIYGTIHNRSSAGTSGIGSSIAVADACKAFHDYQVEWTVDRIDFMVDGKRYHTYRNKHSGHAQWPFHKPMYLLLNLAIGGDMAGAVDDRIFPRTFEIDYVRVYRKRGG